MVVKDLGAGDAEGSCFREEGAVRTAPHRIHGCLLGSEDAFGKHQIGTKHSPQFTGTCKFG